MKPEVNTTRDDRQGLRRRFAGVPVVKKRRGPLCKDDESRGPADQQAFHSLGRPEQNYFRWPDFGVDVFLRQEASDIEEEQDTGQEPPATLPSHEDVRSSVPTGDEPHAMRAIHATVGDTADNIQGRGGDGRPLVVSEPPPDDPQVAQTSLPLTTFRASQTTGLKRDQDGSITGAGRILQVGNNLALNPVDLESTLSRPLILSMSQRKGPWLAAAGTVRPTDAIESRSQHVRRLGHNAGAESMTSPGPSGATHRLAYEVQPTPDTASQYDCPALKRASSYSSPESTLRYFLQSADFRYTTSG